MSRRSEPGSRMAPDRLWAPNSAAFSTTITEASSFWPEAALRASRRSLKRMAAASPAGPPPTTRTSVSRTSLSGTLSLGREVGLGRRRELGEDLEHVAHDAVVGDLEDRGVRVLVDG